MKDYSSIIVSSKVRLLRNLIGFEFPSMLTEQEGIKVLNKVADTVLNLDKSFKIYRIKTLSEISELDVNIMHEKKLITSRLMDAYGYGAVVLSENEDISIMINESDHISEQCMLKGLSLINAYDRINYIDNQILSKLEIAFDDSIGFLTSNIADVGTGLKAGVTLFLPALTLSGKIREITSTLQSQGLDLSSMNDDEIESEAYTYTLSNSQTIGKKETDYVVRVTEFAIKIADMEVKARTDMVSYQKIDDVRDKVYRAWGILTNCYKINVAESSELLGEIKMGVALDLIRFKEVNFIDKLMQDILPYSLTKISESKVTYLELDKYRATFLSNVLKSKRIK